MALSGSVKTSSYDGRYVQLDWTATQSVANNTSTISWTLKATGGDDSWYAERTLKVVLGGSTIYSKTARVERRAGTIATGTKTITHDSNGNASFSVSIQAAIYYSAVNCTGSGSFTLNNIPRASSFGTISGNTIGSAITVNINRNSSAFTHSLWYSFGGLTWQGIGSGIGTSKAFTPPLSICSQIPKATSGTMTLILRTYNGSTQIGSDVYKTITVYVPSSVKPSISSVGISEANTGVVPSSWGVYVQNKSRLKFVTSASGSYGSSISSIKVNVNSKNYTGSTITTDVMSSSGNKTATITVTDSRGRTATTTKTINVVAYSNPYITKISAIRCNEDGTANASGTYAKITIVGGVSSISGKNSYSYQIKYKKNTDSTYTTHTITNNSTAINTSVVLSGFDTDHSYDIVGVVNDYFTSTSKGVTLPTAFVTVDYMNGGKGIAFGKVAELLDYIDFNFKALFRKNPVLTNNVSLQGQTVDGEKDLHLLGVSEVDNTVLGYGGYDNAIGSTHVYGNNVRIYSKNEITFDKGINVGGTIKQNGVAVSLVGHGHTSYLPMTGGTISGSILAKGTSAETQVGAYYSDSAKLYLWGNVTSGSRGLWDSGLNQYVIQYYADHGNYRHFGNYFFNPQAGYVNLSTIGDGASLKCNDGTYAVFLEYDCWRPQYANTGVLQLGTNNCKWKQVFADTTSISTSDRNAKKDFTDFDERYEKLFNELKPQLFRFKDGESNRFHSGFVSQDVEESLINNGLTALDFAGFCKDKKQQVKEITEDGAEVFEDVLDENGNPIYAYSLRYSEFIALNTHMIQKQQKEIEELKKQIEELKALVKGAQ